MKRRLLTFALAALTIGLLGSCSKINERIDGLDKRVYDLENNKIASIEQQIATINQSIADLSTIRTNIQTLMDAKTAMGEDITTLKAADITLEGKINDLKTYVDTELAKYPTKDWANATFATLTKQAEIITDVEKLKTGLVGLDTKLDQAIANLDSSLKGWVNEQLSGYYTIAQVDAKVDGIQSDIDALKTDNETNKTKIEELETSLTQLTQDLENAKTTIKAEYEKAIKDAIEGNDGYITETIKTAIATANGKIDDLTARVGTLESDVAALSGDVDALKAMIQTVSIIPAYNNGSVKAEDGILTINCVITPKEAVESLKKENFTILTSESEVLTKSALYGTLTIAKDEDLVLDKTNGTATIKVDVSSVLPTEEDKALTVAVNVKNGISDFTTDFVPVYVAAAPGPVLPDGALAGKFTVDAFGTKVHFSQGNLQATYSTSTSKYTWGFAANQYSYKGNAAGNTSIDSQTDGAVVDLFGWSTASTTYGISTSALSSSYSGDFVDWGKAYCENKSITPDNTWRTLSKDEWTYLLKIRTMTKGGARSENLTSSGITVEGVTFKGVVLFPDDFTDQADWKTKYTTWKALNDAGIVFLPAAGWRNGSNVYNVGSRGYYWTSTANGGRAYDVYFSNSGVTPGNDEGRDCGCSVRLVTEPGAPAPQVISVESVSLNKSTLELAVGSDETLTATITPDNATDKSVSWSSSDESVATVDASGKVTAVAAGTATITVTTEDGSKAATCAVTVVTPTPTTTGTAKATIGGKDVDVKWVQLWENGPKFAEYNATEAGWGANWCTPSKDDLEHLLNAASGKTDEKVTCEHTSENSVWGFKFTGKEDGYTNNSVFFPNTSYGSDAVSTGYYWSSTYDSEEEGNWLMTLSYIVGNWYSGWCIGNNDYFTDNELDKSLVKYRLVLSNK